MSFFFEDKWDSAVDLLCAVKPWYQRYARRFTVVPFSIEPEAGKKWGGYIFSTPNWELYADSNFVRSAPLEHIAGLIERELQRAVRDISGRLRYVDKEYFQKYGNIAAEMEICDVLRSEHVSINEAFARDSRRALFPPERLKKWGVTDTPVIPDETAWLPELIGMPSGMSLEDYYQRFVHLELERSRDGEDNDATESNNSEDDSLSELSGESGTEQESYADDEGESSNKDVDRENDGSDSSVKKGGDEGSSDEDVAGENSEGEPSGEDDSGALGSGSASMGENGENAGHNDNEDEGNSVGGNGGEEQGVDSSDSVSGSEPPPGSSDAQSEQEGDNTSGGSSGGRSADVPQEECLENGGGIDEIAQGGEDTAEHEEDATAILDNVEELRKESGRDWYTRNYEPIVKERHPVGSSSRDTEALKEFAEDVMKYSQSGGSMRGSTPGELSLEVSREILSSVNLSWDKILEQMVTDRVGDSKISGMQDVSYEVRNPHQPRYGVIMPGMYDSPVTISLVIDTSGSMLKHLPKTLGVINDVLSAATEGSEEGVQWVSVDVGVAASGKAYTLDESILQGSSRGFGGTDIGWVLRDISTGIFSHNGLTFDKPDVLVVVTDCEWEFPEPDNPVFGKDAGIVVVSVKRWEDLWQHYPAPAWLNEGVNWVYADDSA